MEVTWKRGYRFEKFVKPEIAFEAIEKIRNANNGEVTPEMLVKAAKAKRHPLHSTIYELDDAEAANEHRLDRARYVMRCIEIERPEIDNKPVRVYSVGRSNFTPRPQAYRDTKELLEDPDERAELLKRALNQLVNLRRQFRHLQELAVVVRAIDEVLEQTEV